MSNSQRSPFWSLALAGLFLGALGQTNWFLLYAGLLFGFSMVIGLKRPPQMMRWILVLTAGTPITYILWLMLGWSKGGRFWYIDALMRAGGALVAILPGLGAGLVYRRISPRMRKSAA
ncbi:MAG: hypothetical protein HY821_19485 [Acidobacteria bacterium]|nr:hypothetical protein [Acidobacteriota bacterium]